MTSDDAIQAVSSDLIELARLNGVTTEYYDWQGQMRQVDRHTILAVLAALGIAVDDEASIREAVQRAALREWEQAIPPFLIVRQGHEARLPVTVPVGLPAVAWIDLDDDPALGGEGGRLLLDAADAAQSDTHRPTPVVGGRIVEQIAFVLPASLPLGWHTVRAQCVGFAEASGTVVVCPERLELTGGLDERRGWGVMTQLYSIRSHDSWGLGDFSDLAALAATCGGADFLLINPLHAGEPCPPLTPSPYLPSSRLFLNPIYIRPEATPEYATAPSQVRQLVDSLAVRSRQNQDETTLDRDQAWTCKRAALQALFDAPRDPQREADFANFRAERGASLEDFALWCVLTDTVWQAEVGASLPLPAHVMPSSAQAAALVGEYADRVAFFAWLQWVAQAQLAQAQAAAEAAGMRLGLMTDLAVGVHTKGADAWALRSVLAAGVSVGAPPDYFNQQGQDWSQPPWSPGALAANGYQAYRNMLRAVLRSAGALRIDHILGLFRLWWIPEGGGPGDGTYVRFDHEAMVGILILEAYRARAVVVGEDLGVVEPWVRDYLGSRGVLGTSIVWFEKTEDGVSPLPPDRYRRLALTAVTTHDLPPTAAYLAGAHVDLRQSLGLLTVPIEQAKAEAADERAGMVGLLVDHGLLRPEDTETVLPVSQALHRMLLETPSVLLGISLADLVGETRTQNLPGTDREYPNWSVPLSDAEGHPVYIEDLATNPVFTAIRATFTG